MDETQAEAVNLSLDLSKRLIGVTGPAGTGKTTLMQAAIDELKAKGYSVGLCAFMGKGARRITQATGHEALTIHKMLEFTSPGDPDPKTGKPSGRSFPTRDRQRPLDFDVVFVDEAQTVNQELFRDLYAAMKPGSALRAYGDLNQLPPIEEDKRQAALPSEFARILDKFPSVRLEKIYRQGDGSTIVTNGVRILKGFTPTQSHEFTIKVTEQPVNAMIDYWDACDADGIDFASLDNQIITPMNKSWIGTSQLNATLQTHRWQGLDVDFRDIPRDTWVKEPLQLTVGDKVIFTKNNYDILDDQGGKGVFNGEVGHVKEFGDFDEIMVDMGDRVLIVPPLQEIVFPDGSVRTIDPRKSVYLAYALTTHKVQGSQYDHVVYIMNKSVQAMLYRSNFYTGISRAMKRVHVITDMKSISRAVANTQPYFGK